MPIKANKIAQHVVKNGLNATVNREFTREVNKELNREITRGFSGLWPMQRLHSRWDAANSEITQLRQRTGTRFNPSIISYAPWYGIPELVKNVHDQLYASHEDTHKWRPAMIISILKPGKSPEEAGSYRPISLLSVCFKLLERLIYIRLPHVVDTQLSREQAGFRHGRITVEQVVKLTEDIETAFENRQKCGTVFVDLSAAYDIMRYRGLALKMLQLIPNKCMVRFIRELITNRSFKLYVGKNSSKP